MNEWIKYQCTNSASLLEINSETPEFVERNPIPHRYGKRIQGRKVAEGCECFQPLKVQNADDGSFRRQKEMRRSAKSIQLLNCHFVSKQFIDSMPLILKCYAAGWGGGGICL